MHLLRMCESEAIIYIDLALPVTMWLDISGGMTGLDDYNTKVSQ